MVWVKKKYSLKKTVVRNYPPVYAVYGRKKDKINVNASTKPMTRKKKKRFGIFKKSEEWENEYKYQWY